MIVSYTHIPLARLALRRDEVEDFVAQLNEALGENSGFANAVITNDNELAIDARLARRLNL